MKRPVRTRMQGVVGAGGGKPPATRLAYENAATSKESAKTEGTVEFYYRIKEGSATLVES